MKKQICLMMSVILLFNFILPCIFHRSFASSHYTEPGNVPAVKPSYNIIATEGAGLTNDGNNNYPYISFKVQESGLYTIDVTYAGSHVDYEILDSSHTPLALAAEAGTTRLPSKNRKVKVYLKAGQTYDVPIYKIPGNTGKPYSVSIIPEKVPATDDDVVEFDYSSSNYTNQGSRADSYRTKDFTINRNGTAFSGTNKLTEDEYTAPAGSTSIVDNVSKKQVSVLQKLVTIFFVYGICEQLRAIINAMFGPVSIDEILFNRYSSTKLTFYPENGKNDPDKWNPYLAESDTGKTVLEVINEYFNYFRGIAIMFYLAILLYVGIRVILKSTAKDRDKYKAMLTDWAKGVIILFLFPLVIKYSILLNEALVGLVEKIKSEDSYMPSSMSSEEADQLLGVQVNSAADNNIMFTYKQLALDSGSLGFAFVYFYLILSIISFILIYFKRLITIIFLIVLFPFVSISYALDKIKDGKAQIFNNWFRELILNIFMQLFHAISYVVVTTIITAIMGSSDEPNIILVIIALGYVKKSDELLKILFPNVMSGGGAGTVKPVSQVMQTAGTVAAINQIKNQGRAMKGRVLNAKNQIDTAKETGYEYRNRKNKIAESEEEERAEQRRENEANEAMSGSNLRNIANNLTPESVSGSETTSGVRLPGGIIAGSVGSASRAGGSGSAGSSSSSSSDIPSRIAVPGEAQVTETMQTVQKIAAVIERPGKRLEVKEKLQNAGLTQEQQAKMMQLVDAQVAMNEVLTGKNKQGVPLVRKQLNIQVKVLNDLISGPEAEIPGTSGYIMKKHLEQNQITIKKPQYMIGDRPLELKPGDEDKSVKEKFYRLKAEAELEPDKTKRELLLSKFDDSKTQKVTMSALDYVQKELTHGRVLSEGQRKEARVADTWLAGTTGVDFDTSKAKKVSRTGLKLGSLTSKQGKKLLEKHEDDINDVINQFAPSANASGQKRMREAAGIMITLQEYERRREIDKDDPTLDKKVKEQHIDGVDAAEMLKLTSRLNQLQKQDSNVKRMISESLDTGKTDKRPTGITLQSGNVLKVNMGTSLDTMEAASATAVLSTPREEIDDSTRSAMRDAVASMQRVNEQSDDSTALGFLNNSEHDNILDAKSMSDVIDEFGYLVSDGKNQEEIVYEKYIDEKVNIRVQLADESMAKLKTQFIGDALRAGGATVSATGGTITAASLGLAGTAVIAGASSDVSGKNLAINYSTTSSLENLVEKVLPGGYGATDSSLGNMTLNTIEGSAKASAEKRDFEKDTAESKKIADNSVAAARAKTIRDAMKRK